MSRPYIECISVSKHYKNKRKLFTALDGVDLQIARNEIVIIKGRSGAGKSTLLNILCGLIDATSGTVRIGDDIISRMTDNALSRLLLYKVGIIFQNFNLIPNYNVYENIELSLLPKRLSRNEMHNIIMPLLGQFNLADKTDLLPSELSAGQQQKLAIARTVARKPSVIFADEPTGSVDAETASEILEYFRLLRSDGNTTLVIATHGVVPDQMADRLVMMDAGRII